VDILGFLFTGVLAKGAKASLSPLIKASKSGPSAIARVLNKNPKIKETIIKMIDNSNSVAGKLKSVATRLQKSFPKASSFIKTVLSGMANVLTKFVNVLRTFIGGTSKVVKTVTGGATKTGKGVRSGGATAGISYGIDTRQASKQAGLDNALIGANDKIKPDYTDVDF
jgi:hypothetical protein